MWLISLLVACPAPKSNVDCDAMALASVNVELSGQDGELLQDAEVTFSVDGGEPQPCEEWPEGSWSCGWEVAGEITVYADAWGYTPISETVTVEQDVCHVVPQDLQLALAPVDCPTVEIPSVVVNVEDEEGQPLADAEVNYAPQDELWTNPEPCDDDGGGRFLCGWGYSGLINIEAYADDLQPAFTEVDVPEAECGPVTQEITLTLAP